jgi:hypothetical protein
MDLAEADGRWLGPAARHPWELARLGIVRSLIRRHAPLPVGAIALDVGCGDLFVAGRLGAEHPHATFYAIDSAFTADLIGQWRARGPTANVRPLASLDAVPAIERRASLVLLLDVIEHVADDRAFLARIVQGPHVGAETTVLVTVPAHPSLFCSHDRRLGHFRRYSRARLRTVLAEAGLRPLEAGSFFASLIPVRLVRVAHERLYGSNPSDPADPPTELATWRGGRALSRMLTRMLMLDGAMSRALGRTGVPLPGLSLYAACRPSA